jgi:hypothetical protein
MRRQFVGQKQKSESSRKRPVEGGTSDTELRRGTRFSILQRCLVRPTSLSVTDGALAPEGWQCMAYNISATGIGIALPLILCEGTELSIQRWDLPGLAALTARIVHTKPVDFLWFAGCALSKRLSDAELEIWKSGSASWMDKHK